MEYVVTLTQKIKTDVEAESAHEALQIALSRIEESKPVFVPSNHVIKEK